MRVPVIMLCGVAVLVGGCAPSPETLCTTIVESEVDGVTGEPVRTRDPEKAAERKRIFVPECTKMMDETKKSHPDGYACWSKCTMKTIQAPPGTHGTGCEASCGAPPEGSYWKKLADQMRRLQEATARQEAASKTAEANRLLARLKEQSKQIDEIIAQLAAAKTDAERADLKTRLAAATAEKEKTKRALGAVQNGSGGAATVDAGCPPGDPMCGL